MRPTTLLTFWHTINDPGLSRYWHTTPPYLVLHQPGTCQYMLGSIILRPLTLLTLLLGYSASLALMPLVILTLLIAAVGLYQMAAGSEHWRESRRHDASTLAWIMLYAILINFPKDTTLRTFCFEALDENGCLRYDTYAQLVPALAEHLTKQALEYGEYPCEFLVHPKIACLAELGLTIDSRPLYPRRHPRPIRTRRTAPTWAPVPQGLPA